MNNHQDSIKQLEAKLETLLSKQEGFAKELMDVYKEIELLKQGKAIIPEPKQADPEPQVRLAEAEPKPVLAVQEKIVEESIQAMDTPEPKEPSKIDKIVKKVAEQNKKPAKKSSLEKFVGENLINKIGILITIIGVVIGAKYSIENNLISPLTRIILGYVVGLALLAFGIKLKKKYANYSAVLVSGAITILYFISFAAYDLYGILPQLLTFILMVLFTVFAVVAALNYNKQIIAHIGLVGAYAVPFLLSTGAGDVLTLFSYMAIINTGILVVAFKKYWKPLYYVAFIFTWIIYNFWAGFSYVEENHFSIALGFASLFFVIFYLAFMGYKFIKKEQFNTGDVIVVFLNSFIYYGVGYYLVSENEGTTDLLGLFTLGNALIHFVVATMVFKQKLADKKLFYLIATLTLTFITITIPVQLDGDWVTILWAVEAALLFWIGSAKHIKLYKNLSYILAFLAFFSIFQDWDKAYSYSAYSQIDFNRTPFLNIHFLSSVLVFISFGISAWLINSKRNKGVEEGPTVSATGIDKIMSFSMPVLFFIVGYFSIFLEIDAYGNQLFQKSMLRIPDIDQYLEYNYSLLTFNDIWLLNYSLLFFTILSFVNIKKIKNRILGIANIALNVLFIFIFLAFGLYSMSELRSDYISEYLAEYYTISSYLLTIRYISFIFLGGLIFALYSYSKQSFLQLQFKIHLEIGLHFIALWLLSSELLHWMDLSGISNSYKMNLSILWGTYALFMVIMGIWKRKKFLRITGIVLFAGTLLKLFFYDIADLDTISKTIVFVSLGFLLLVISFLYNKYTKHIEDEPTNE